MIATLTPQGSRSGRHGAARRAKVIVRVGRFSVRYDRRMMLAIVGISVLAVFSVAFTLAIGQDYVPLGQVWAGIMGHATPTNELLIRVLRLPRVLVALFAGASLGMSGAIFQSMSGNGLVSPDIIGINSGASVAVVATVVVFHSAQPTPVTALAGSLTAGAIVYLLAIRGAGLSPFRLILIGVGVNATLGAAITYLLLYASQDQLSELNLYFFGDVSGATWTTVQQLVPAAAVLLLIGTALGPQLEVLQLGKPVAMGIGARVERIRVGLLLTGTGLAAISVAAAGPIGFVAFIAPHIARGIARSPGNGVLPLSAAVGGALVVIGDYAGQRVLEPTQLPVGLLTVVIGGPYFMYLLLRTSRRHGG